MPQPVAIAIVTWNSADEIGPCLDAAVQEDPEEIVIVDNGSCDTTLSVVRQHAPQATIIELGENRGFSVGCNRGVDASHAPYVLFLNGDAILSTGYVSTLVAALEAHPGAASAVGKLVYHEDGKRYIDSAGIDLRLHAMSPLDRGYGELDVGQYDRAQEIFGPSAAAALYRRTALLAIGPEVFDETLFAYYEDVDLAWRLRRRGWKHLYVPSATGEHKRRGPDNKPVAIAARAFSNRLQVWIKNDSLVHLILCGPLLTVRELLRLARLVWRRPEMLRAVLAAIRDVRGVARKTRAT